MEGECGSWPRLRIGTQDRIKELIVIGVGLKRAGDFNTKAVGFNENKHSPLG